MSDGLSTTVPLRVLRSASQSQGPSVLPPHGEDGFVSVIGRDLSSTYLTDRIYPGPETFRPPPPSNPTSGPTRPTSVLPFPPLFFPDERRSPRLSRDLTKEGGPTKVSFGPLGQTPSSKIPFSFVSEQ